MTILVAFDGTNGYGPQGGLVQASDGNLYGGTLGDWNSSKYGTIFRLSLPLPASFQRIDRTGNTLAFTWTSVASQHYQVQYRTNLATDWLDLGAPLTATNGTTTTVDTIDANSQRLYRVVTLP